jgi:hypothetical protein
MQQHLHKFMGRIKEPADPARRPTHAGGLAAAGPPAAAHAAQEDGLRRPATGRRARQELRSL